MQKVCPFCENFWSQYIDENDSACVFVAKGAYREGHILICPKHHIESSEKLTQKQKNDIQTLIYKWGEIIGKNFGEHVIFLREGKPGGSTGKTQNHLHWHIIPNFQIFYHNGVDESQQKISDNRHFFTDEEYEKEILKLKNLNS